MRRGDLHAAVVPVGGDREVEHVGRNHAVVDDVGALRGRAVDERRGEAGEERRMSRPTAMRFAPRYATKPRADGPSGVLVDFAGIDPAHVVGLEDRPG